VALFSGTPAELAAFYGMLLGLRFERRVHEDGRDHRICRLGGVHVEIKAARTASGEPTPDAAGGARGEVSSIELSFEVENAARSREYALTLGASELQDVSEHSWGTWAVVLDPDGNRMGLWSRPNETLTTNDESGSR
jgi:predicted enzyme related to lactoylglutathione lyase